MIWKGRYRGMLPPMMRNSSGNPAGSLGWRSAASSLSDLTKNGSETEITMRFLSYN
jgi:hypothetical protein